MPSEQKTPLGLNQWTKDDRPKREDFNNDNAAIDLACRTTLETLTGHLEGDLHLTPDREEALKSAQQHTQADIASEKGLHGLRYFGGQLEVQVGGAWISCIPEAPALPVYKTYGVCIDLSNADPTASVTYTDDAVGMSGCSSRWLDTFLGQVRPCLLKDGVIVRYLNSGNYAQGEDGTPADITSGKEGDVMIEIPLTAYAIYTEGDRLYVKVTDNPDAPAQDARFCLSAHTRAQQGDRRNVYVGAYLSCVQDGRLRSLSGKSPFHNASIADCRGLARQNGDNYDLLSYYPFLLLQCFTLIYCGSRHTQSVLGMGCVEKYTALPLTGATDGKGLFFGSDNAEAQIKVFGLEDFWGNFFYWVDGVRTDGKELETATANFSRDSAWNPSGYSGEDISTRYIGEVYGNNQVGFLISGSRPDSGPGAHWCDVARFLSDGAPSYCFVGGCNSSRQMAGAFYHMLTSTEDLADPIVSARLMYL